MLAWLAPFRIIVVFFSRLVDERRRYEDPPFRA